MANPIRTVTLNHFLKRCKQDYNDLLQFDEKKDQKLIGKIVYNCIIIEEFELYAGFIKFKDDKDSKPVIYFEDFQVIIAEQLMKLLYEERCLAKSKY